MSLIDDRRFSLRRITPIEWSIRDDRYLPGDARGVVARIYQVENYEVEVAWLRDLPLMRLYGTVYEVLDEVRRIHTKRTQSDRPKPIPHMRPFGVN